MGVLAFETINELELEIFDGHNCKKYSSSVILKKIMIALVNFNSHRYIFDLFSLHSTCLNVFCDDLFSIIMFYLVL